MMNLEEVPFSAQQGSNPKHFGEYSIIKGVGVSWPSDQMGHVRIIFNSSHNPVTILPTAVTSSQVINEGLKALQPRSNRSQDDTNAFSDRLQINQLSRLVNINKVTYTYLFNINRADKVPMFE